MPGKLLIEYLGAIYPVLAFARSLEARRQAETPEEEELKLRRKSNPLALANATRLRQETTLTLNRIAPPMGLGTTKRTTARIHKWMRGTNLQGLQSGRTKYEQNRYDMDCRF